MSVLSSVTVTDGSLNEDRLLAAAFIAAFLILASSLRCSPRARSRANWPAFSTRAAGWAAATSHRPSKPPGAMSSPLSARSSTACRASSSAGSRRSARGCSAGLEEPIFAAERRALEDDGIGEASEGDMHIATVALGEMVPGGPTHGLITICARAAASPAKTWSCCGRWPPARPLAMANVSLHLETQRQAVTDDLTGLASHGRFQEILSAEMDQVRRYQYPVGLVMLDIDNVKSVNDAHGHPQGRPRAALRRRCPA